MPIEKIHPEPAYRFNRDAIRLIHVALFHLFTERHDQYPFSMADIKALCAIEFPAYGA